MLLREYLKKQHFKLSYSDLLKLFTDISNEMLSKYPNENCSFSLDNIKISKKNFSYNGKTTSNIPWKRSLVLLIIECLTGVKMVDYDEKYIEPLHGTKLYWALKRAINEKIMLII